MLSLAAWPSLAWDLVLGRNNAPSRYHDYPQMTGQNQNMFYQNWAKKHGHKTYFDFNAVDPYDKLGGFCPMIDRMMHDADKIHVLCDDVPASQEDHESDEYGYPKNGNYIGYEMFLLRTKYSHKVTWLLNDKPAKAACAK
jgi:hypothetical protein